MPDLKEIFGSRIELPDGGHLDVVGTPNDSAIPNETMSAAEINMHFDSIWRREYILKELKKMCSIAQVNSDAASPSKDENPTQFVVRYAADMISPAMTSEELATALAERRLLPEMLFSVVGTEQWQSLEFVAQNSCWKHHSKITLVQADFTLARRIIVCGIVTCLLGMLHSAFLFVGFVIVLWGIWNVVFMWVNTFFTNALKLLVRIANNSDSI
jgi:hypothetical protein